MNKQLLATLDQDLLVTRRYYRLARLGGLTRNELQVLGHLCKEFDTELVLAVPDLFRRLEDEVPMDANGPLGVRYSTLEADFAQLWLSDLHPSTRHLPIIRRYLAIYRRGLWRVCCPEWYRERCLLHELLAT